MTATAGVPTAAGLDLVAHADVQFDAWLSWTDAAGAVVDLSAYLAARVRFGPKGSWEVGLADIDMTTSATTVGRVTLAATSPNMKLSIPAVVMAAADFRRLHYVLEVTDPAGVMRRWAEGDLILDKAEV